MFGAILAKLHLSSTCACYICKVKLLFAHDDAKLESKMKVTYCERTHRWTAFYKLADGRPLVADDMTPTLAMAGLFVLIASHKSKGE